MDDAESFSIAAAAGRDALIEGGTALEAALAAATLSAVVVTDHAGHRASAIAGTVHPFVRKR